MARWRSPIPGSVRRRGRPSRWMTHKFAALHGVRRRRPNWLTRLGGGIDIRCCNDAAAAVVGRGGPPVPASDHRPGARCHAGHRPRCAAFVDRRSASIPEVGRPRSWAISTAVISPDGRLADDALSARTLPAAPAGRRRRRTSTSRVRSRPRPTFLASDRRGDSTPTIVDRSVAAAPASFEDVRTGGAGRAGGLDRARAEPARLGAWAPIIGAARICFG